MKKTSQLPFRLEQTMRERLEKQAQLRGGIPLAQVMRGYIDDGLNRDEKNQFRRRRRTKAK